MLSVSPLCSIDSLPFLANSCPFVFCVVCLDFICHFLHGDAHHGTCVIVESMNVGICHGSMN